MKGRRKGHMRTSKNGVTFPVREHAFQSGAASREFTLTWRGCEARINGSTTYQMHCPHCKKPVFFYRNDAGSRVFFDALGKPWPKHDCEQGVRRMQNISIVEAIPVTKKNRFDENKASKERSGIILDIDRITSALDTYFRSKKGRKQVPTKKFKKKKK